MIKEIRKQHQHPRRMKRSPIHKGLIKSCVLLSARPINTQYNTQILLHRYRIETQCIELPVSERYNSQSNRPQLLKHIIFLKRCSKLTVKMYFTTNKSEMKVQVFKSIITSAYVSKRSQSTQHWISLRFHIGLPVNVKESVKQK